MRCRKKNELTGPSKAEFATHVMIVLQNNRTISLLDMQRRAETMGHFVSLKGNSSAAWRHLVGTAMRSTIIIEYIDFGPLGYRNITSCECMTDKGKNS